MANFSGTDGIDVIIGTSANDSFSGRAGNDVFTGEAGNDRLNGGAGDDVFTGDAGNDSLNGGTGDDIFTGDAGNDSLNGGADKDILVGDFGRDTLTGGAGADDFGFGVPREGIDTITDFVAADDTIQVSTSGFGGGLTAGAAIKPGQFRLGAAAGDANDRFIYNRNTGALFFDVDGTGSTGQVQIATLTNKPQITNADIFVSPQISVTQGNLTQSDINQLNSLLENLF